ncbi:uncharacterized protein DEA37_0014821, partial [Paragonimus westermani]
RKACPYFGARIATMESSISSADSVQSDSDIDASVTVRHTTAVSTDVSHASGAVTHHRSGCKNEATLSEEHKPPDDVPNKMITKFNVVNGLHAPRFHRFYLESSDDVLHAMSPVIYHKPEPDAVPKSSRLVSVQEAVRVRSLNSDPNSFTSPQPHYVKLKHYGKTLHVPNSNCTNSNPLPLPSSVEVTHTVHGVSSFSVTPPSQSLRTSTVVTMTSSNLVEPQALLSKLGHTIKLGRRHAKAETLPGRSAE